MVVDCSHIEELQTVAFEILFIISFILYLVAFARFDSGSAHLLLVIGTDEKRLDPTDAA